MMSEDQLTVEEKDFLRYLSESGLIHLEPEVTPDGVIYKDLETGEYDWKQILFMFKSLTKKGYLDEEDHDRAIFCPNCDSPHVYSKYACPVDRSIFIKKVTLLQHITDGFHGEKEVFEKEDRLICPKCGEDLGHAHDSATHDESLREIGFSFECEKSGHKFEKPLVLHFCPDCGSMFDYKTARYVPLYAYSMTEMAKSFLRENLDFEKKLAPLVQLLESEGSTAWSQSDCSPPIMTFDVPSVQPNIDTCSATGSMPLDVTIASLGPRPFARFRYILCKSD